MSFQIFQIFEVAGVGQFVVIDNKIMRIFPIDIADKIRADKAGAAGDEHFHIRVKKKANSIALTLIFSGHLVNGVDNKDKLPSNKD
jgi:hypothetical protein